MSENTVKIGDLFSVNDRELVNSDLNDDKGIYVGIDDEVCLKLLCIGNDGNPTFVYVPRSVIQKLKVNTDSLDFGTPIMTHGGRRGICLSSPDDTDSGELSVYMLDDQKHHRINKIDLEVRPLER